MSVTVKRSAIAASRRAARRTLFTRESWWRSRCRTASTALDRRRQEARVGRRVDVGRLDGAQPCQLERLVERADEIVPLPAARRICAGVTSSQRLRRLAARAGRSGTSRRRFPRRAGTTSVHSSSSRPQVAAGGSNGCRVMRGVEQALAVEHGVAGSNSSASQPSPARYGQLQRREVGSAAPNAPASSVACSQACSFSRTRATPCSQSSTGKSTPGCVRQERVSSAARAGRVARSPARRPCVGASVNSGISAHVFAEQALPAAAAPRRARPADGVVRVQCASAASAAVATPCARRRAAPSTLGDEGERRRRARRRASRTASVERVEAAAAAGRRRAATYGSSPVVAQQGLELPALGCASSTRRSLRARAR